MNIKNKLYLSAGISIVLVAIGISVGGCQKQVERYTGPVEKISVGATTQELSTLIWIAEEKGYFEENGLDATVKAYDTGIETKNALLAGEVDVADTVDFVITGLGLEGVDIKVLASINTAIIDYIIARRDRGISSLSDLKDKKIGIKPGSSAEYYLGRTLVFNGLSLEDVELVAIHPPDMPEAIAQGEVDATITWHPHNYHIKNSLGDNAIVWSAHGGQDVYWVVFSRDEFIQKYPEKIKRLLKTLVQAEEFVKHNNLEAKEIIARRVNLDLPYIESIWSDFHFVVDLTQSMIIAMEDQARWKIANNLTDKTEVPNYLDYIYLDALEEVKPEAIGIIR
jgi:NitT/TauT family transport system substrate-binding protein